MPWSDLNLVVSFRIRSLTEKEVLKHVERFRDFLTIQPDFLLNSEVGERKNISILKLNLNQRFLNKRVEIIFRRSMIQSVPKTENIILDYLESYPISRMLFLIVRKILHSSGLDDPAQGGINSFAIFLMIIAFIQKIESSSGELNVGLKVLQKNDGQSSILNTSLSDMNNFQVESDPKALSNLMKYYINCNKVGEIFMNFMYFYGYLFDYATNYIHTYISRFSKCHPFYLKKDSTLCALMILNPFDQNLIITKSFKKTANMKQIFKLIYNHYFARCVCDSKYGLELSSFNFNFGKSKVVLEQEVHFGEDLNGVLTNKQNYYAGYSQCEMTKTRENSITAEQNQKCRNSLNLGIKKSNGLKSRLSRKSTLFISQDAVERNVSHPLDIKDFGYKVQSMFLYNFC